jgi:DNA-binding MarR family transcriptional regulator
MPYAIDILEVSACTCRRARRTARQLTHIYNTALKPTGLTANQFDLLTNLFGATLTGQKRLPIGVLASRMGMHPTTLTRDLRPLIDRRLAEDGPDPRDGRIRAVHITAKGRERLREAVPYWRLAEKQVRCALGPEASHALNELLDVAFAKLTP